MLMRIARCALCTALVTCASASLSQTEALAQSAADKATARQLATEGIKLYGAGKYQEALDNLQRAQAMYDAPVHLLYLARTHAKLGNLVESAETYRRLQRVQLEAGAPKAFKEAVASADKELAEVEPRVPALRIEVEPAGVQGLELRIDGETVPAAAIGVDRAVNPGERKVAVWAQGYSKAEASVTLAEGEKKKISLKLVLGQGPGPGGDTAGTATAGPTPGPAGDQGVGGTTEPAQPPSKIGFMVGLRLGGAIPSGTAYVNKAGQEVGINDEFQSGFGGELHGGVRFLKYFTGVLFIEAYSLRPGSSLDALSDTGAVEVTNFTSTSGGGIGVMIGSERGRFGGFGELGILPVHNFEISRDIVAAATPTLLTGARCTASVSLKGAAVRVGGGLSIPVASFLNLTPYIMATFGRIGSSESEHDCPAGTPEVDAFIAQHDVGEGSSHQLFVLGVGGDFLIGRDAPVTSARNETPAVTNF